jgi:hypothetical protein
MALASLLAHVNTRALQNLYTGGHILGLKDVSFAKNKPSKQDYYLFQEVLGAPSHVSLWTSHLCKSWWQEVLLGDCR